MVQSLKAVAARQAKNSSLAQWSRELPPHSTDRTLATARSSWTFKTEIGGVTLRIQPRPNETPMRRCMTFAEVPLASRPDVRVDGKIVIADHIARQSENAIERFADLAAVATFSTRRITAAVPAAELSDVTAADRQWLANCSGLSQPTQHLRLVPVAFAITDAALAGLDDRRDGVELLAEALADTHETGRFREITRFFELAFRAQPTALVRALADFLNHYDKLQYTHDEVERWHQLRNRATHADRGGRRYVLAGEIRPVLMRVELAAYDVLFNKLNWHQADSGRRDIWEPAGGVLPDERHAVIRAHAPVRFEAQPLFDGFDAYPYDPTCKIDQHPEDWWLDTGLPPQGQTSIDTVSSLRSR